jgi:hypothetical protein
MSHFNLPSIRSLLKVDPFDGAKACSGPLAGGTFFVPFIELNKFQWENLRSFSQKIQFLIQIF